MKSNVQYVFICFFKKGIPWFVVKSENAELPIVVLFIIYLANEKELVMSAGPKPLRASLKIDRNFRGRQCRLTKSEVICCVILVKSLAPEL